MLSADKVYVGFGNALWLEPFADMEAGQALDMSGATKVEVCIQGAVYDSDTDPNAIAWEEVDEVWYIVLRLGLLSGLAPGEDNARIAVFDGAHLDGVVLDPFLTIEIIGPC